METSRIYPVFLSSVCKPKEEIGSLRENIYFKAGEEKYIYVDEIVNPLRNLQQHVHLETVDALFQRIREARVYICILGGTGPGSAIKVGKSESNVSFFEIELFQAALMGKHIHVFVHKDFAPDPQLGKLFEMLNFYLPEWISAKRLGNTEIVNQCKRLVIQDRIVSPFRSLQHLYHPIRRFVQGLHTMRNKSKLDFFRVDISRHAEPNSDLLKELYEFIRAQPNEERRLTRLGIGIRELMAAHYSTCSDLKFLQYWNYFLGEWSKAGAWYGLNADTPLGCLAALNGMTEVRSSLRRYHSANSTDIGYPGGALASAKYSIAKRLIIKQDRRRRFQEALNDLAKAMEIQKSDEAGLRAIRGSIYRQLGNIAEAISEYEAVLQLRKESNTSNSATIGEAMSELGYAYLRDLQLRKGLDYCREGVELLRCSTRPGFLVRGLRKLAIAYFCNRMFKKAFDAKKEARKLAIAHGTFDQL